MSCRILSILFLLSFCLNLGAHDLGARQILWNREISRIFYKRCAECHRDGGTSFPLMTYGQVQPRVEAIKHAVLSRRMPPWGAVKGFGDFRNDEGLTPEELELITAWIDGDLGKGNNPNVLPQPPKFTKTAPFKKPKNGISVSGDLTLSRAFTLDGLLPEKVPLGISIQIVAALPDGSIEPLLWLYQYQEAYRHPFLFRAALDLPSGTRILGVPSEATIVLIPVRNPKSPEDHRLPP